MTARFLLTVSLQVMRMFRQDAFTEIAEFGSRVEAMALIVWGGHQYVFSLDVPVDNLGPALSPVLRAISPILTIGYCIRHAVKYIPYKFLRYNKSARDISRSYQCFIIIFWTRVATDDSNGIAYSPTRIRPRRIRNR